MNWAKIKEMWNDRKQRKLLFLCAFGVIIVLGIISGIFQ